MNDIHIKFNDSDGGHFVLVNRILLALKLIFQLGKHFFQIQHIQHMKKNPDKPHLTRNASRSFFSEICLVYIY